MWFVFPQLRGLGYSAMAQHYGIASLDEARSTWPSPALGRRLHECCELMLAVPGRSALEILGSPDDLEFRSCVTLSRWLLRTTAVSPLPRPFPRRRAPTRTLALCGTMGA